MKIKVTRWYAREWPKLSTDTCDRMTVNNDGFAILWEGKESIAMFPVFRLLLVEMVEE